MESLQRPLDWLVTPLRARDYAPDTRMVTTCDEESSVAAKRDVRHPAVFVADCLEHRQHPLHHRNHDMDHDLLPLHRVDHFLLLQLVDDEQQQDEPENPEAHRPVVKMLEHHHREEREISLLQVLFLLA